MIKITKRPYRNIKHKDRVAELFVCNFNGKITYKYIDSIDDKIRSRSFTDITRAVKDMKNAYKTRQT